MKCENKLKVAHKIVLEIIGVPNQQLPFYKNAAYRTFIKWQLLIFSTSSSRAVARELDS